MDAASQLFSNSVYLICHIFFTLTLNCLPLGYSIVSLQISFSGPHTWQPVINRGQLSTTNVTDSNPTSAYPQILVNAHYRTNNILGFEFALLNGTITLTIFSIFTRYSSFMQTSISWARSALSAYRSVTKPIPRAYTSRPVITLKIH